MTKEEFQKSYYEKTGEWLSEEQLSNYIEYQGYDESPTNYEHTTKQPEHIQRSYFHADDGGDIFDYNLADKFNKILSLIANKAKLSLLEKEGLEDFQSELEEFIFYGELFLAKSILYFILKKGIKKGYSWTKF